MKYQNVKNAMEEAERFIRKSDALLKLTDEAVGNDHLDGDYVVQGHASASVRRSSLELSHLLSQMRKSDWEE